MQAIEMNIVHNDLISDTSSDQRIAEPLIATEAGTYSKASARRIRIESQSAQSRIEDQIACGGDLPLNKENAKRRLQYLDQIIAKSFGEYSNALVFIYTYEKLALHIYLGNTAEAVACLSKLQELENVQPCSDDEDDVFIEGKTAHALLGWAAGDGTAEVMDLATFPDPVTLLLLKAKGIPLPEPYFSVDDSFTGNKEIDEKLFSRNYQEALTLLDKQLKGNKLFVLDREIFLQARGLCKAILDDYEGALQDYNEIIDSHPSFNIQELPLIRGLIHFLNNDPEKARIDIWPPLKEEMTLHDYFWKKFNQINDNLSGFAIVKILDL